MRYEPSCIAGNELVDDDLFVLDDLTEEDRAQVRVIGPRRPVKLGDLSSDAGLRTGVQSGTPRVAESTRGRLIVATRHPWRAKGKAAVRRAVTWIVAVIVLAGLGVAARQGWGAFDSWRQAGRESSLQSSRQAGFAVLPGIEANSRGEDSVPAGPGPEPAREAPANPVMTTPAASSVSDLPAEQDSPSERTGAMSGSRAAVTSSSGASMSDLSDADLALWREFWGELAPCPSDAGTGLPVSLPVTTSGSVVPLADSPVGSAVPSDAVFTIGAAGDEQADNKEVVTDRDQPVEVTLPGDVTVLLYRDETIVELKNGHYFKGKIKKLDGQTITLYYDRGEYTFGLDELEQIVPPGSPEYLPLRRFPEAWVVLANGARFRGRIIKDDDARTIVGYPSGRLTFRRADVAEVRYLTRGDLVVVPTEETLSE